MVWITKYRKPVLSGQVAQRCRESIRQICKAQDVEIIKGHVSRDHIHLFVSVPPHLSVSKLMQQIKGKSSQKMLLVFKSLNRKFWGRHLCARGYFATSSANVTDEVIARYIEQENADREDGDFRNLDLSLK